MNSLVVTKLLHLVIIRLSDNLIAFLASVRIGLALLTALVLVGDASLKSKKNPYQKIVLGLVLQVSSISNTISMIELGFWSNQIFMQYFTFASFD